MSPEKTFTIIITSLLAFNLLHTCYSELYWSTHSLAIPTVIQSVGFTGLVLSSECTATRNPILETICGCLGDIPGGYCYHLSCAIVGVPIIGNQSNQIEVIRR